MELDNSIQQNKVVAFRVISYLAYRKIAFKSGVQALLDMLELSIEKSEKSSVEKMPKKSALVDSLD